MNNSEQQDTGLGVVKGTTPVPLSTQIKNFCKDTIFVILIAVCTSLFIMNFVYIAAVVPTGSMLPTIQLGDRIGIYKFVKFGHFERGDLIVFDGKKYVGENIKLVKRVIGLPGETVSIQNGVVYIDGEALDEPYVVYNLDFDMPEITVPDTDYFVLGDNRENSFDGRYWTVKTVNKDDIIGKGVDSKFQNFVGHVIKEFSDDSRE